MPKSDNQKVKILYILDYLQKNSHEDRLITAQELIRMLDHKGIRCDRKTVYSDIAALQDYGADIVSVPGIKELPLTLECKVIYKQQQYPACMTDPEPHTHYPENSQDIHGDYHTAYYGQIVNAYIIE